MKPRTIAILISGLSTRGLASFVEAPGPAAAPGAVTPVKLEAVNPGELGSAGLTVVGPGVLGSDSTLKTTISYTTDSKRWSTHIQASITNNFVVVSTCVTVTVWYPFARFPTPQNTEACCQFGEYVEKTPMSLPSRVTRRFAWSLAQGP